MLSNSVDRFPNYAESHQTHKTEPIVRERRRRVRVQLHWPVCFMRPGPGETVETVTHDLSSDGFYCVARATFIPGETRECTLGVPMYNPQNGEGVRSVLCRVRVIRVEARDEGWYGVGCRIEDYRFIGSNLDNTSCRRTIFSTE